MVGLRIKYARRLTKSKRIASDFLARSVENECNDGPTKLFNSQRLLIQVV
jgi:hypothetical protein